MVKRLCISAALLLPLLSYGADSVCAKDELVVRYEPEAVTLSGTIAIGQSKHPNGTLMKYPILRLSSPITVEPSSQADPINSRESCVKEVQLFASDKAIHQRLYSFGAKPVTVTGTLFHGHTAWHMRDIVMSVVAAGSK
jgi:hypothetical protein